MKKYFRDLAQHANLSSAETMESGDHSKNGVNLQNLSSAEAMETGDHFFSTLFQGLFSTVCRRMCIGKERLIISIIKKMKKAVVFILITAMVTGSLSAQTEVKKEYYPNGKVKLEYTLKDGKKEGVERKFYENGNKKSEVYYQDGEEDFSKLYYWYETGEKQAEYDESRFIDVEYYKNGNIKRKQIYQNNNIKDFIEKEYYENGKIKMERPSDLEGSSYSTDGIRKDYDENGNLYSETLYDKGHAVSYKLFHANGKIKEEGNYKKSGLRVKEGLVRAYYESGKPQNEYNYKNDLYDGKIIGWYETGEKQFEGNYIAGTGKVINYYRSGTVKFERNYKDGKKEGIEKAYYESGKPEYEYNYKNDLKDGKTIGWYETGEKQSEGNYIAGTGKLINYYRSGTVKFEIHYKDGKKDGIEKVYYESGKPESEYNYKNDLYDGKTINWYETGEKKFEGNFIAGTGKATGYYNSGEVESETHYKDGKKEGIEKVFEKDGKIQIERNYHNGLRDGKYIYFMTEKKKEEGNFSAGTGKITIYSPVTGNVIGEKYYKEDKKDGVWRLYYSNGKPYYSTNFNKGDGTYKRFYMNGVVMEEGSLYDEKLSGKWRLYYKTGTVKASATFSEGSGEGMVSMFYPNGAKMFEGLYNGKSFEGKCTWYYPSGKVKHSGLFTENYLANPEEDFKKGLVIPFVDENQYIEIFSVGNNLLSYVSMIKENKNLLTQDVRTELQQFRKFVQEPLPEYDDLFKMADNGMTYAMIISGVNGFIKTINELIGAE
jgi:antitoxin component YwqK of YwqJK toxin-antitoxin module